jgi:hypothetical protein
VFKRKSAQTPKRRVSRRAAIGAVLLTSIAIPASASVLIQNFIVGSVTGKAACFVKIAGQDSVTYGTAGALAGAGPYVLTDPAPVLAVGGVNFINETVAVRGFAGDRTRYTDVIRYKNNCTIPMSVKLVVEADPAGNPATSAGWNDMTVSGYVSKAGVVVPAMPAQLAVTDLTNTVTWDKQFDISSAAVVTPAGTAQLVAPGAELQGAFSVDVTNGATTTRTFRYTATATA